MNTSFTDDINTMRREIVHKHNSALLPEIPIMGSDFLKLLESIQSKETAIVVEGYGTINVALSLSFDRKSVYKINKQYLRDSFRSNLLRNTDDIKRELVEAMKIDQSGNTVHILRQGKVRVLKKECLGDMQRYFMFLMKCMASKKQIIGDYKNIDNFGVMHGKVKIIDADLLVDLSEDNPSLELMGLCDMVVNDFLTYMMTTEKYQEENDEMDLMHLILGLSSIAQLSNAMRDQVVLSLKNHPYCTESQYHVFVYLLEFLQTDWQDKCAQIGCYSARTTLDLFCMKLSFANAYYSQPDKRRHTIDRSDDELAKDIQREYNPVLMVNRLSECLYRRPSLFQIFLHKLSFFTPILFKYDCLSALSFFCKDSIKLMFIKNQALQEERESSVSKIQRLFSFHRLSHREPVRVEDDVVGQQAVMI